LEQRTVGWSNFLGELSRPELAEVLLSVSSSIFSPQQGVSDVGRIAQGALTGVQTARGLQENRADRASRLAKEGADTGLAEGRTANLPAERRALLAGASLNESRADAVPEETAARGLSAEASHILALARKSEANTNSFLKDSLVSLRQAQTKEAEARAQNVGQTAVTGQERVRDQTAADLIAVGVIDDPAAARLLSGALWNTSRSMPSQTTAQFAASLTSELNELAVQAEIMNNDPEQNQALLDAREAAKRLIEQHAREVGERGILDFGDLLQGPTQESPSDQTGAPGPAQDSGHPPGVQPPPDVDPNTGQDVFTSEKDGDTLKWGGHRWQVDAANRRWRYLGKVR
jgi:hypothetical protein